MLLSFSSFSKSDVQVLEEVSSLQIFSVEYKSLEMKPICLPENGLIVNRLKE